MLQGGVARFGRDILQRPPQPPRISAGSSSEEENFHLISMILSSLSHPGERGPIKFYPGVRHIHCISDLWRKICLHLWRNTPASVENNLYIFAEILTVVEEICPYMANIE